MAEGLQIGPVDESGPNTAVRNDMVNIGGPHPGQVGQVLPSRPAATFPTERFIQQLHRTKVVHPDRQCIPCVPISRLSAAPVSILRAVLVAVASPDQLAAARVCAGPYGSHCHVITSRKNKKPEPRIASAIHGSGSRLRLRGNIHNAFFTAALAVQGEVFNLCGGQQSGQLLLTADRTHEPPLVCLNFITVAIRIQ